MLASSGAENRKIVATGMRKLDILTHGMNFPDFRCALSTITPNSGSLIASQIFTTMKMPPTTVAEIPISVMYSCWNPVTSP